MFGGYLSFPLPGNLYWEAVSVLVLVDVWWVQKIEKALEREHTLVSVLVLVDVWWVQIYLQ